MDKLPVVYMSSFYASMIIMGIIILFINRSKMGLYPVVFSIGGLFLMQKGFSTQLQLIIFFVMLITTWITEIVLNMKAKDINKGK